MKMTRRRGVSLIEVMVALTLFGLMATVHTLVTMRYGLRTRIAAVGAARAGALSTAVDLFSTLPAASIAGNVGCATISLNAAYVHERCVTSTAVTSTISRLQIIITPTNTAFRPDTVWVDRVTGVSTPPFT